MTTPASLSTPEAIGHFFTQVYGRGPDAIQEKKNTVYSVPGEHVSMVTDSYGGCHVEVKAVSSLHSNAPSHISPEAAARVREAMAQLAEAFKASGAFDSLWIDVALPAPANLLGMLAPDSFQMGLPEKSDLILDYQNKQVKAWQWLNPNKECAIPAGATHNIGATAVLVDKAAERVLLVVNKRRDTAWNLPGGSYEPGKDKTPSDTALREAQEEGGFEIAKEALSAPKLTGQMQFPYNQFAPAINQIWAYRGDGISHLPLNPPAHEVKRAEWMDVASVLKSDGKLEGLALGGEIKSAVWAAVVGLGCEEILNKGWMTVHSVK